MQHKRVYRPEKEPGIEADGGGVVKGQIEPEKRNRRDSDDQPEDLFLQTSARGSIFANLSPRVYFCKPQPEDLFLQALARGSILNLVVLLLFAAAPFVITFRVTLGYSCPATGLCLPGTAYAADAAYAWLCTAYAADAAYA